MGMKSLVPLSILLAGMFITGCTTPEDVFLGTPTPVAVGPENPTPDVAATNAAPAEPVVVVQEKPAPVETEPAVVVTNTPPDAVATSIAPGAPVDAAPAATRPGVAKPVADPDALPTIVTPDTSIAGKVVSYNSAGRFVLINFPVGLMPKVDQTLFLYRNGLKIGEIKITGPQRDTITVADVISGDAQVDDDARDK